MTEHSASPFSERDVRWMYRLLRHTGFATVVHCQNGKEVVDRRLVNGEEELVAWAKEFNGRGNCYLGRNPRRPGSPEILDALTAFSFDLDPDRDVGAPADAGGRDAAGRAARRLMALLPGGVLVDSGNGYQVVYGWSPKRGEDVELFGRRSKLFLESVAENLGDIGAVKLDHVHDPERLIRLPGTVNVKGGRLARFVAPPLLDSRGESIYQRIASTPLPAPQGTAGGERDRSFVEEVRVATDALRGLRPDRREDYFLWLNVGMSLRSLGPTGLQLWDEWSKGSPKYEEGACERKWETFEPGEAGQTITLGSLIAWAREDGAAVGGRSGVVPAAGGSATASYSTADLLSYAKDVEWMVPGLIPKQGVTILGGQEGVGKSWLALDLALSVSRGLPWLGALPTRKGRVLYLDEESSPQLLKRRLSRLLLGQLAPTSDALEFRIGAGVNFSDPTWVEGFAASLREKGADLVVIDSLVRSHRGEENSAAEMSKVFAAVKRLVAEHGVAVLFLDHESKQAMAPTEAGQDKREPSTRDLRGSNEKGAFSDSILLAKRVGPQLAIHHVKSRWAEATRSFMAAVTDTPEGATMVRKV